LATPAWAAGAASARAVAPTVIIAITNRRLLRKFKGLVLSVRERFITR
jgi:hypothetical protein